MKKTSDKLERARSRANNSLVELARMEARERSKESARDTRRKILLGAAVETMMRTDENLRARFASFMPDFLKRRQDLEVFDLVDSEVTYFDRLVASVESEIDEAVNSLTEKRGPHLGASKAQSITTPLRNQTNPDQHGGTGGANGTAPRPPPVPSSSSPTSS